jgi:hypothetical protein
MILALVLIFGTIGLAFLLRPWPFFLTQDESQSYRDGNVAVEFVLWVERQARARGLSVRGVAKIFQLFCLSRRGLRTLLARQPQAGYDFRKRATSVHLEFNRWKCGLRLFSYRASSPSFVKIFFFFIHARLTNLSFHPVEVE